MRCAKCTNVPRAANLAAQLQPLEHTVGVRARHHTRRMDVCLVNIRYEHNRTTLRNATHKVFESAASRMFKLVCVR